MFMVITKKQVEKYINDYVNGVIEQYEINYLKSNIENINSRINILKQNINQIVNDLHKRMNQMERELVCLKSNSEKSEGNFQKRQSESYVINKDIISRMIQEELQPYLRSIQENFEEIKKNQSRITSNIRNNPVSDVNYINQIMQFQEQVQYEIENEKGEIQILKNTLYQQSIKINESEKQLKRQAQEIEELKNMIYILKKNIDNKNTGELKQSVRNENIENESYVVFGDDKQINGKYLKNILIQTKQLRHKVECMTEIQDLNVYLKLIDKCILKMEQLLSKNEKGQLNSEQLANNCATILRQSIIKAMSQKKLKNLLDGYMKSCNLKKLDWHVGRKLSDEDFEYLEEPIIYKKIDDKRMDNAICEVIYDTYIISYKDDDEEYDVIIPGSYCLGKLEK